MHSLANNGSEGYTSVAVCFGEVFPSHRVSFIMRHLTAPQLAAQMLSGISVLTCHQIILGLSTSTPLQRMEERC